MGVPGFFLWLCVKAKKLKCIDDIILQRLIEGDLEEDIIKRKDIDWFLIDANCAIHPTCFKVLKEIEGDINNSKLEGKMINAVIEYFEHLINYVSPVKGVLLSIDGVAPAAKIKQQRYRRFKSIYDRDLENRIRQKHNKEEKKHWNNSAITPGTEFMERLHNKINSWIREKKDAKDKSKITYKTIIYSSCKTPSEGEHKLLQFIKDNKEKKEIYSYVVYGLDADLIFLTLAANNPNIYLLREANELDKKNKGSSNELNYVSIDSLRDFIFSTVNSIIEHKNIELKDSENMELENSKSENEDSEVFTSIPEDKKMNIINDFIFICYLLGNDFLPHLESIDIYDGGIDILLDKYTELIISNGLTSFIIDRKVNKSGMVYHNINQGMFVELISYLASEESEYLKNSFLNKHKKRPKCTSSDEFEKEWFRIENVLFKYPDPIQLGSDDSELWKDRYYKHHFKHLNSCSESDYKDHINSMIFEYLKGLKWVTRYYFDSVPSWTWFYKYDYPPFIEDLYNYLSDNKISFSFSKSIKFNYGKPLRPFNQLLMVLPPQSAYLVPVSFRHLMLDKNSELVKRGIYPRKIELDFIGKHKLFMAIPILPEIDLDIVHEKYKEIENKMQESKKTNTKEGKINEIILKRNIINNDYIYKF